MKLQLIIEIDATYDNCEAALEDIETAVQEEEDVALHIAGTHYSVLLTAVTELPAIGRPPKVTP